jgi:methyl-accepting chemotaxis protein
MQKDQVQKLALTITRGIGSPTSIIIHSIIFISCFLAAASGNIEWDKMLLVLTTIVSLEAIYLSIFIQMTINYTTESLEGVAEDIEEVQEDIGEIQEDIEEVQEDVDELQENVEDISEDVEEMSEEEAEDETRKREQKGALDAIKNDLQKLLLDVERLKNNEKK